MKVLIIDNNIDRDSWGSPNLKRYTLKHPNATAFVRRGPHDDLPKSVRGFDKIMLSGSKTSCLEEGPWISRLDDLIREALNESKPLLGVCYGHQSLNRALGGREILGKNPIPEFGWTKIELLQENNPLFTGLPKEFYSFSWHYEAVMKLPKGMKHLARSADCEIQACQLEDRPVWGIQFHPEKKFEDAVNGLAKRVKEGHTEGLLHPNDGAKLFDEKVGDLIFGNFLRA